MQVAEAKARKRRREVMRRLKAKKKLENIVGNEDMDYREKMKEMKK